MTNLIDLSRWDNIKIYFRELATFKYLHVHMYSIELFTYLLSKDLHFQSLGDFECFKFGTI